MSNHTIIVAEFMTLDGVIEDPDGTWGTTGGGWALRQGPHVFAGDKFQLAPVMANGSLLFGRGTWEVFATRWPARTGEFADAINAARKFVASTTLADVDGWANTTVLEGDLIDAVARLRHDGDVAVIGSPGLAHQLAAADLVDQYRMLVVPSVVGTGTRLFADGHQSELRLVSSEVVDAGLFVRYDVVRPNRSGRDGFAGIEVEDVQVLDRDRDLGGVSGADS